MVGADAACDETLSVDSASGEVEFWAGTFAQLRMFEGV